MPIASILVSESINLRFYGSFLFKSRLNSGSPIEPILPDTERISAAGVFSCAPIKAVERPAGVKQTRKDVATKRQVESHYGTNRSIKAQADSQSGRKSA